MSAEVFVVVSFRKEKLIIMKRTIFYKLFIRIGGIKLPILVTVGFWYHAIHKKFLQRFDTIFG